MRSEKKSKYVYILYILLIVCNVTLLFLICFTIHKENFFGFKTKEQSVFEEKIYENTNVKYKTREQLQKQNDNIAKIKFEIETQTAEKLTVEQIEEQIKDLTKTTELIGLIILAETHEQNKKLIDLKIAGEITKEIISAQIKNLKNIEKAIKELVEYVIKTTNYIKPQIKILNEKQITDNDADFFKAKNKDQIKKSIGDFKNIEELIEKLIEVCIEIEKKIVEQIQEISIINL